MHIQINTDKNVEGPDAFADQMKAIVESTLNRFSEHITRVEVHLSVMRIATKLASTTSVA